MAESGPGVESGGTLLLPGGSSYVPRAPAVNMNTRCKVRFDYLIKRYPLCLLSDGVAMETSGQAPRGCWAGANYQGRCEEQAHRRPLS